MRPGLSRRNVTARAGCTIALAVGLGSAARLYPGALPAGSSPSLAAEQFLMDQQQTSNGDELPNGTAPNPGPAPGEAPVAGDVPAPAQNRGNRADDKKPTGTNRAGNRDTDENAKVGSSVVREVGSEKAAVKEGSIEDVNAVGSRNIGGRGLGNWFSLESEIKMGKQYAMDIERSTRFVTDPAVTEYVNRIGQNIVKNSDCKVPFTIKIIDSDEINAMALPGGFFYINSGLLLNADEEAEMAGVMAHEIAHVCAHHAARQMTRMRYTQLGMVPLIMMTGYGWTSFGIYQAAQLAVPVAFLKFSRDFEEQADYLGIQYAYRSGYDPQATITFFEKIQALEKRKPGALARAFSDHPQTPDRIAHSQEEIARVLPARDQYVVTTSEFEDVKGRLARIQNKRRLTDSKEKEKPSLRRASHGSGDPNTTDTYEQDRPTLHPREDEGK